MIFHLHIEKSGGKSIEFNVARAIGDGCRRTSQIIGDQQEQRRLSLQPSQSFLDQTDAKFVTGHFCFGMHRCFGVDDPIYISIIRHPVERIKSYYNYIMNSPMYSHKEFILRHKITFEQFALGDYPDDNAPYEFAFVACNGQSKMLAADCAQENVGQQELLTAALRNVGSVEYYLFPTERSTEAFFFLLEKLNQSVFRRYLRVNSAPYDHVGRIGADLRGRIEDNNQSDFALYEFAIEQYSQRRNRRFELAAQIARYFDVWVRASKKAIGPTRINWLRERYSAVGSRPTGMEEEKGAKAVIPSTIGREERTLEILSSDLKGVRYLNKTNWDDIPHRLWRSAVAQSDLVIDVGSNYGEFVMILCDGEVGADTKIISIEANPSVAECQEKSVAALNFANQIEILNKAASSQSGKMVFRVNPADTGSSGFGLKSAKAIEIETEVITIDGLFEENGVNGNIALKIDVEGHDVEVLRGSLGALSKANSFFVTLEIGAVEWKELKSLMGEGTIFGGYDCYVYIWNSLFHVTPGFDLTGLYEGFFDLYVTNDANLAKLLRSYATEFDVARVRVA